MKNNVMWNLAKKPPVTLYDKLKKYWERIINYWNSFRPLPLKYFIKYGDKINYEWGFVTELEALCFIDDHLERRQVEWVSGYSFRLVGDDKDVTIVDENGVPLVYMEDHENLN
jgi:hypothetical protein